MVCRYNDLDIGEDCLLNIGFIFLGLNIVCVVDEFWLNFWYLFFDDFKLLGGKLNGRSKELDKLNILLVLFDYIIGFVNNLFWGFFWVFFEFEVLFYVKS